MFHHENKEEALIKLLNTLHKIIPEINSHKDSEGLIQAIREQNRQQAIIWSKEFKKFLAQIKKEDLLKLTLYVMQMQNKKIKEQEAGLLIGKNGDIVCINLYRACADTFQFHPHYYDKIAPEMNTLHKIIFANMESVSRDHIEKAMANAIYYTLMKKELPEHSLALIKLAHAITTALQPAFSKKVEEDMSLPNSSNELLQRKPKPPQTASVRMFKKIYMALRDGQTRKISSLFFKSNFLLDKESLRHKDLKKLIQDYCLSHPGSRTAEAWRLASLYKRTTSNNNELITQIYKWSYNHSGLLKRSSLNEEYFEPGSGLFNVHNLSVQDVVLGKNKKGSRLANICAALEKEYPVTLSKSREYELQQRNIEAEASAMATFMSNPPLSQGEMKQIMADHPLREDAALEKLRAEAALEEAQNKDNDISSPSI